jgi:two-component system, cell cycle response regulator
MIGDGEILNANILIVDDQEIGARALQRVLHEAGYVNVNFTTDPFAVAKLHKAKHFQIILLDIEMPGRNGFQVMEDLITFAAGDYLPVLALSVEPTYKLHALKRGAKDFICKPFDAQEVLTRIHNMLEVRLKHEDALEAATTFEKLAQQDPLTGLANRRLLTKRICAGIANARRQKTEMALIYLDLDGFKQINDTAGHATGDALLKDVAKRLQSVVREEDTVARVGGDEFMVALWHVQSGSDVITVAQKLVNAISMPYFIDDCSINVTTSAGVGIYPAHGTDPEALMRSADTALYAAKRLGKNAFRIYTT